MGDVSGAGYVSGTGYVEKGDIAMCYATKRKIADCVKSLMRHKEISRITIGDIMEATMMSRQSFYYHFRDIYDVLEWIGQNDFKEQLTGENYDSMEAWVCDLMRVLRREHVFYEKLASELAWPRIVKCVKPALKMQVSRLLLCENEQMFAKHEEELEAVADFLATSIGYYMMDYVYARKKLPEECVESDVKFIMQMICERGANLPVAFPKVAAL